MTETAGWLVPGEPSLILCPDCVTDEQKRKGWMLLDVPRQDEYLIDLNCEQCGKEI